MHSSLVEGAGLGARQHRLGGEGRHEARVALGWPRTSKRLSWGLQAHVEVQRQVGMAVIQGRLLTPIQRKSAQLPRHLSETGSRKGKGEKL